ncbi:MAG TPA: PfkB family carbohydrate kinase [Ignavibacteriaceae bacterium]|nr:PfkB family carbohydrate kinase [Ignavibacteriaceae bacterium]
MNVTSIGEILFDIYPSHKKLGGAPLNFIYHIRKITGSGNIISRVGKDVLGTKAISEIKKQEIPTEYIQIDDMYPTGVANIEINKDKEPGFSIDTERAFDFIESNDETEKLINYETDVLYFGTLSQRNDKSRETIQSFFKRGGRYFCDVNLRQNFYNEEIIGRSIETADIVKVNYNELKIINDILLGGDYNTERTAFEIMEQFEVSLFAVTRGKNGATLFENGKRNDFTPEQSEIVDTTGAGDAFSSVLCIGFMQGWELPQINKNANKFALEICKVDGALPKSDRIYEELITLTNSF